MKYLVEMHYSYGWDSAGWADENDNEQEFDTREEAQRAIDDFIADCASAVGAGHMQFGHSPEEFRIVTKETKP